MANSRYEYVRSFEQPDILLANTWIVVRIDGRGFSKFTTKHKFTKPNDRRALDLMNAATTAVMRELPDLCLAYGNSDEFSFVFHKNCALFERRASKLTTTIVSTFSSYYTFLWPEYFPDSPLTPPLPSFDGRAVCYPSDQNLRDYMSWRQVDCHINNLYNTTFWTLVLKGGMDARAAEQELSGTFSADKNEILFSRFGINYNNEPDIFKKGSVLYRDFFPTPPESTTKSTAMDSSMPLANPQPLKTETRPMPESIERTANDLQDSETTPRGPTFLSTSTTPSPPPSPPSMSIPNFSLPQNSTFLPSNGTSTSASKLGMLTPIPLPPPTLSPSTKPPASLIPPNHIFRTNLSPQTSPTPPLKSPHRTSSSTPTKLTSLSASASLSNSTLRPETATPPSSRPTHKQRSPSLSILDSSPPQIPLRMSSIPTNNQPRKLSLHSHRSQKSEGTGTGTGTETRSSSMSTMKELPSPPAASGKEGEKQDQDLSLEETPTAVEGQTSPSAVSELPKEARRRARLSSTYSSPPTAIKHTSESLTSKSAKPNKPVKVNSSKAKAKNTEDGGWAAGTKEEEERGAPKEMSRTQKEKERKKRTKARIVIEHIDVIRDEFWEKRPWILSGKAGI